MSYSAGTVFLEVVPSFRNLQRAVATEATRAGKEFNKAFRDTSGHDLDRAVSDGVRGRRGGGKSVMAEEGEKQAKSFANSFEERMKRSVHRVTETLKNADIGGDMMARLEELGNAHIGVDVDAGDAVAEMENLRVKLQAIADADHIDFDARFDAGLAAAELHKFAAQANRDLRNRKMKVDIDFDGDGQAVNAKTVEAKAKNQGRKAARAFQRGFDGELQKATADARRSLGMKRIKVDADTDEATRKLALLQTRLVKLDEKNIGVDVSTADAIAEIASIQAALDELGTQSPDIRIQVDTAATAASLAAVQAQVARAAHDRDLRINARFGTTEFDLAVERAVAKAKALLGNALGVTLDSSDADRELATLQNRLRALTGKHIGVDIDSEEAMVEVRELSTRLEALGAQHPDVKVKADIGKALAELRVLSAAADRAARDRRLKVDVDSRGADRALGNTSGLMRGFSGILLGLVALGPLLIPMLASLAGGVAAVGAAIPAAGVGIGVLVAALAGIMPAVKAMGEVQKNAAKDALAGAKTMRTAEKGLVTAARGIRDAKRGITAAQKGVVDAQRGVTQAQVAAARSEESLGDTRQRVARDTIDAARAVATAQKGVARSEQALADARDTAARDAVNAARSVESALAARTRSERTLADAREAAARDTVNAAHSVESALAARTRSERTLADAQKASLRSEADLADARRKAAAEAVDLDLAMREGQLSEREAVMSLNAAKIAYASTISDTGSTATERENSLLALQSQQLSIEKLRLDNERLAKEKADSDRKGVEGSDRVVSAQENIANSAQSVADAQVGVKSAVRDVADAYDAQSRQAVAGQRAIADAQVAVKSAVRDVSDAYDAQSRQAIAGRRAIADAQAAVGDSVRAVADAYDAQSRQAVDGQRSIRDATVAVADAQDGVVRAQERVGDALLGVLTAQERLSDASAAQADAQQNYQDALEKTGEIGSASMKKLRDAMNALSPAGQRFATFLFSLRGELDKVRAAAQEGLLPGLQAGMETLISTYGPGFIDMVGRVAQSLGDLFEGTLKKFSSPEWQGIFGRMSERMPDMVASLGKILVSLTEFVFAFSDTFGDFTQSVLDGTSDVIDGWTEWAKSLRDSDGLKGFIDYLKEAGPKVGKLLKSIVDAFINLGKALAPYADKLMDVVTGFFNAIADMDPHLLASLVLAFGALLGLFQVLTGLGAVIGLVVQLAAAFGIGIAAASAIIGIVLLLGAALVFCYFKFEGFRNVVDATVKAIGIGFVWLWDKVLKPTLAFIWDAIKVLGDVLKWTWDYVLWPVIKALSAAIVWLWERITKPYLELMWNYYKLVGTILKGVWDYVIWPVLKLFGLIMRELWNASIKPVLGWIGDGFKALGSGMKWVYDYIIKPMFNGFVVGINKLWDGIKLAVDNIGESFKGIIDYFQKPINFVIDVVFNKGLIAAYNWIADKIHTSTIPDIPHVSRPGGGGSRGFADGGVMPGYTPGRDPHRFYSQTAGELNLSGGEAILRPELTRVLGTSWVDGANAAARTGGVRGAMGFLTGGEKQSFAGGGIYNQMFAYVKKKFPQARLNDGYRPGAHDMHGRGHAIDIGKIGEAGGIGTPFLASVNRWLADTRGKNLAELIYDGKGDDRSDIKNGKPLNYGAKTNAQHVHHVHLGVESMAALLNPNGAGGSFGKGGGGDEGGGGFWGFLDKFLHPLDYIKDKVTGLLGGVTDKFGKSPLTDLVTAVPKFALSQLGSVIGKLFGHEDEPSGGGSRGFTVNRNSANVGRWIEQARKYTEISRDEESRLRVLIQRESGGEPRAINLWDSNAKAGHPSKGLVQTIDSTFQANRDNRLPNDIYNPVASIVAGMNYIRRNYGNIFNVQQGNPNQVAKGYADGGVMPGDIANLNATLFDNGGDVPRGLSLIEHRSATPDRVYTDRDMAEIKKLAGGRSGGHSVSIDARGRDLSAADLAEEMLFAFRRADQGGVYAGSRP